ncbi:hypothetical protein B0H10DRAFT_1772714 [Mycena sp. CBHHK59/15]|nr:hypothetical protein B0H10DRAFT_1772714 [Mycena sp. CBHHK59/15]
MVNHHISSDLNERALDLWQAGCDVQEICYAFHVSPCSLYHWHDVFNEFGAVTKLPSLLRGCNQLVSLAALTSAKDVYFKDPSVMLTDMMWHLAINHDITIFISALQAMLVQAGLTCKVLQKIVSKHDKVRRTDYQACICDPQSFSATYSADFVQEDHYTLTAAMSTQGYIATHIVLGSMDAFLTLVWQLPQMKLYLDVQSVLILDNCQIHHTDLLSTQEL